MKRTNWWRTFLVGKPESWMENQSTTTSTTGSPLSIQRRTTPTTSGVQCTTDTMSAGSISLSLSARIRYHLVHCRFSATWCLVALVPCCHQCLHHELTLRKTECSCVGTVYVKNCKSWSCLFFNIVWLDSPVGCQCGSQKLKALPWLKLKGTSNKLGWNELSCIEYITCAPSYSNQEVWPAVLASLI